MLLLRRFFTGSHLWLLQWSHSCVRVLHIPIPHQLHLSNAPFSFISELSMILVKTYRKSIEEAEPSSIAGLGLCEPVFFSVLKQLNKNWSEKFCFSHVYHLLLPLHFLMAVFNLLNSVEKLICFLKDFFVFPSAVRMIQLEGYFPSYLLDTLHHCEIIYWLFLSFPSFHSSDAMFQWHHCWMHILQTLLLISEITHTLQCTRLFKIKGKVQKPDKHR